VSGLRTIPREGLVQATINVLREQVAAGFWPVGSRIPTESELTRQLGVSRNTLREAVRALIHSGLLEARQGQGTYVMAVDGVNRTLTQFLGEGGLVEVLEVRRGLEVEAAGLAALRRDANDLAQMRSALEREDEAILAQVWSKVVDADLDFHVAIAVATRNPVLLRLYQSFCDAVRDSLGATIGQIARNSTGTMHVPLMAAIEAGDASGARRAAAEGFDFLTKEVLSASRGKKPVLDLDE
jgi:DNA-binding FadR family transcriptional regulator